MLTQDEKNRLFGKYEMNRKLCLFSMLARAIYYERQAGVEIKTTAKVFGLSEDELNEIYAEGRRLVVTE